VGGWTVFRYGLQGGEDSYGLQVFSCGWWGRESGPGFCDDFRWGSGIGAFGEFFGGEEFGIAVVAVAGAEEVEEALLGDGEVGGRCGNKMREFFFPFGKLRVRMTMLWGLGEPQVLRLRCASLRMTIGGGGLRITIGRGGGCCLGCLCWLGCGAWFGWEGLEGGLEGVDKLAGAAGVDGVGGEAVDDGGEGDEDGGAVLDDGEVHAGDLRVDEDALILAVGLLDLVVIAVILALERGRAAALAGRSLVVVALLVA
jgi:hypothetical protein